MIVQVQSRCTGAEVQSRSEVGQTEVQVKSAVMLSAEDDNYDVNDVQLGTSSQVNTHDFQW